MDPSLSVKGKCTGSEGPVHCWREIRCTVTPRTVHPHRAPLVRDREYPQGSAVGNKVSCKDAEGPRRSGLRSGCPTTGGKNHTTPTIRSFSRVRSRRICHYWVGTSPEGVVDSCPEPHQRVSAGLGRTSEPSSVPTYPVTLRTPLRLSHHPHSREETRRGRPLSLNLGPILSTFCPPRTPDPPGLVSRSGPGRDDRLDQESGGGPSVSGTVNPRVCDTENDNSGAVGLS